MTDQCCSPLPIKRADGCIIVQRRAFDVGQRLDKSRPLVDAGHCAAHEGNPAEVPWIARDQDVPWIAESLGDLAAQIARRRGTKDGHDKVRALRDAPDAEGQTEVILMTRDTPPPGDVDHTAHADRRVDDKASDRSPGTPEFT